MANVTDDDVYIIDKGNKLYLFCGSTCNAMEKYKVSCLIGMNHNWIKMYCLSNVYTVARSDICLRVCGSWMRLLSYLRHHLHL